MLLDKISNNFTIKNVLRQSSYAEINRDPTKSIQKKIYEMLFNHKQDYTDTDCKTNIPYYTKSPHL